jgi:hypothetical protein
MPLSSHRVNGSAGIGVLMGNSLMFQRFPNHNGYDDPQFSNFYGQTLPLVKRGIPVQTVHMENLRYPATLRPLKVLVMSYANMKPLSPDVHRYIAGWVRRGGTLIYCGRDDDPYQGVMEWWDTGGNAFKAPSQHLFKVLGIAEAAARATPARGASSDAGPSPAPARYTVGKGTVYILRQDPKEFVLRSSGDSAYVRILRQAYGDLRVKNNFYLERGPYDIISVLDENPDTTSFVVPGPVIDLFDPALPVLAAKVVHPGEQTLLYDLRRAPAAPAVLASASRIYAAHTAGRSFSFVAKSPAATIDASRVLLPAKPTSVSVADPGGAPLPGVQSSWDASSRTLFLGFPNSPEGVHVRLHW